MVEIQASHKNTMHWETIHQDKFDMLASHTEINKIKCPHVIHQNVLQVIGISGTESQALSDCSHSNPEHSMWYKSILCVIYLGRLHSSPWNVILM